MLGENVVVANHVKLFWLLNKYNAILATTTLQGYITLESVNKATMEQVHHQVQSLSGLGFVNKACKCCQKDSIKYT